jgi:RNase P subunit RPR2
VLPEWVEGWDRLDPRQRSQLLGALRVFIEECPTCGGAVVPGTDTVESCCRETTVVDFTCRECGDSLLEVPQEEAVA